MKLLYIYYLFIRHISYPTTAGSAHNNAKKRDKKDRTKEGEKRRKNGSGQRAKPSTLTLPTDALIGEEEQNRKQINNYIYSATWLSLSE